MAESNLNLKKLGGILFDTGCIKFIRTGSSYRNMSLR